jgi:para-nitrobenzyl esterase
MEPTVETSYGKLRGTAQDGLAVFRGIPFARPPVGPLRFRPPQASEPWAGMRDASRFGRAALQNASALGPMIGFDIGEMGEDCLHLNVWTPACDGARRPVLVWIHGGAFILGAGSQSLYDGSVLARRGDVVVVTINYRLGSFGFLDLAAVCGEAVPATSNAGLLDQIAALEWVRNEIAAFGGDPANVTIFGESAGAISVATLLGTPAAQGLFQRAILQSGSANFASSRERSARVAAAFLRALEIAPRDAGKLAQLAPEPILAAQQQVFLSMQTEMRGLPFTPVVDGDVLPRHPFEAIRDGLSKDVAVIVGTNLDEMKLFGLMDPQARTLDEAGLVHRCERNVPGTGGGGVSHGRRAVETYRRARAARGAPTEPPDLWFAIDSDRAFRYPAMRLAELQAMHQPHTYAYLFTWTSPFLGGALGACHALELPFVFGVLQDPLFQNFTGSGPAADALAERIQDAWIAFARTGDPRHAGLDQWPGYESGRRATMLLDAACRMENAPLEEERRFWDGVHPDA